MNADHTNLLALLGQVVDSLASGLRSRTHKDDDVLGILGSIVREEVILTACNLADFAEIVLNHLRYLVVVFVASLTVCEECLGVLGSTACERTLRRERTVAEVLDVGRIYELCYVFLIHHLHLMVFVRSAETVEEVDERHVGLECCQVRNSREVHHFLHRA